MAGALQTPPIDRHELRRLRLKAGLTQPALAKRAGISRPTIAGLEHGRRNGSPSTHVALADALGVELEALYAGRVA